MLIGLMTPSYVMVILLLVEDMLVELMTALYVLVTVQVEAGVLIVPDVMVGVGLSLLVATIPFLVMWLMMTFATGS